MILSDMNSGQIQLTRPMMTMVDQCVTAFAIHIVRKSIERGYMRITEYITCCIARFFLTLERTTHACAAID